MKKLPFLLFAICFTIASCSKDETTQEEEQARIDIMYQEIIDYSQIDSKACTNPEEWSFTKFGASTCSGYLIYNKKIDLTVFQKKIDKYIEERGKFDVKWGVYYDCIMMPPPKSIECKDGKPILIYDFTTH